MSISVTTHVLPSVQSKLFKNLHHSIPIFVTKLLMQLINIVMFASSMTLYVLSYLFSCIYEFWIYNLMSKVKINQSNFPSQSISYCPVLYEITADRVRMIAILQSQTSREKEPQENDLSSNVGGCFYSIYFQNLS